MATKSARMFTSQWPNVSDPTELPNSPIASVQDLALEAGDTCYSVSDSTLYTCTDPTPTAAVWSSGGGGGGVTSYVQVGQYNYIQQAVPVEDRIGQFEFDPTESPLGTYKFRCLVTPTFSSAGWMIVRIYDLGPAAGPPSAPVEITADDPSVYNLETSSSGLQFIETAALTTHATTPSAGVVVNGSRMYDVTIEQDSTAGDEVYVGFVGLVVEV